MNLEHIELLLKRIDTAVKVIDTLKNREKVYIVEMAKIKAQNRILSKENDGLKSEIKKTDNLHDQLENKIQEILQHIPDNIDDLPEMTDLSTDDNVDDALIEEIPLEESEEVRLKNLVDHPDDFEKKDLFVEEEKKESPISNSGLAGRMNISIDENIQDDSNSSISNEDKPEDKIEVTNEIQEPDNSSEETLSTDKSDSSTEESNTDIKFDETLLEDENKGVNFDFNPEVRNDDTLPPGVL